MTPILAILREIKRRCGVLQTHKHPGAETPIREILIKRQRTQQHFVCRVLLLLWSQYNEHKHTHPAKQKNCGEFADLATQG